jgi:hypothetical protein
VSTTAARKTTADPDPAEVPEDLARARQIAERNADPENAKPVIDFDLAPERQTVRKGGRLFEVRRLDDFGIAKQQQLDRDGREFARLWNSDAELTADQGQRLKLLLERIFQDLLDAPKTVRASFKDAEKARLVLDFSLAPLREQMAALLAAQMQQQMAGADEARDGEPITAT